MYDDQLFQVPAFLLKDVITALIKTGKFLIYLIYIPVGEREINTQTVR
jgi:hypothetical protein